jgi:hypothetical protein
VKICNWKIKTMRVQCHVCGKEMQLTEGDVIFGGKWYHKSCAKQTTSITSTHDTSKII